MKKKSSAIVVLSGGQDSVTCLGIARRVYAEFSAISFTYGQLHAVDIECARRLVKHLGIPHTVVDISFMSGLVSSGLLQTKEQASVSDPHPIMASVPNSFVPGRNALFLTLAHALAQTTGASTIMTGVCETDYSGYPDCRSGFIRDLQNALNHGYLTDIDIATPLMNRSKMETFLLASVNDILPEVLAMSHTCYEGDHTTWNEWGFGCGSCPACLLRAKGWEEFKTLYPTAAQKGVDGALALLAKGVAL